MTKFVAEWLGRRMAGAGKGKQGLPVFVHRRGMGRCHLMLAESSDTLLVQEFLQIRRKRLLHFLKTDLSGLRLRGVLRLGLLG